MTIIDQLKQVFSKKKEEKKSEPTPQAAPVEADEALLRKILESLSAITKEVEEKFTGVENRVTSVETKIDDESKFNEVEERIVKLESTLEQFTKIYDLVTSQYNPFLKDAAERAKAPQQTQSFAPPQTSQTQTVPQQTTTQQVAPQPMVQQGSQQPVQQQTQQQATSQSQVPQQQLAGGPVATENASPAQPQSVGEISTQDDAQYMPEPEEPAPPPKPKIADPRTKTITVDEDKAFVTYSDHVSKSLADLRTAVAEIDDDEFVMFVSAEKNDFANWIRTTLGDDLLASNLESVANRDKLLAIIDEALSL